MGLSGYQKALDSMNDTSGREAAIFSGRSPGKNVVSYERHQARFGNDFLMAD
jgi:hypothetical protein